MASQARSFRLCLTGPECTGKSELALRLAAELGAELVLEYAREYAEEVRRELTASDVEPIARGEIANLDRAAGPRVVLDTDLLSTVVYARHYYGACPAWIEEEARRRMADFYLLMDTDVPWTADAIRGEEGDREDLFDAFRRALDELGARWVIVSGTGEERWEEVVRCARAW